MTSRTGLHLPRWAPTVRDVGEAVLTLATTTLGLAAAVALVGGVRADDARAVVLAAVVVAVGDLLLRAPLRFLARRGGAAPALGLGLLAQLAVLWVALGGGPRIRAGNPWALLGGLGLAAGGLAGRGGGGGGAGPGGDNPWAGGGGGGGAGGRRGGGGGGEGGEHRRLRRARPGGARGGAASRGGRPSPGRGGPPPGRDAGRPAGRRGGARA